MSESVIMPEEAQAARRVLIINVTRIGDTLLTTPAIRAIAAHFPHAKLTCLGHPERVSVLQHLPYLNKVGSITKKTAPWRGRLRFWQPPEYDWAFVWGNDAALHRYALRKARRVVAYKQSHNGQADESLNRRFYQTVDEPPLYSHHAVLQQLLLPQSVGIAPVGHWLDYVVTLAETQAARLRLNSDAGANRPLIGLQMASFPTKAYRNWPITHFVELAKRTLQRHPTARFVLFGGHDDRPLIDTFARELQHQAIVYAGQLSLRETVAVMSQLDVYVGVDTGPTHLYGALGKPMVVLYHPSLPSALYKPLQHPALFAVDHPLAGPSCPSTVPMAEISVDTVWERLQLALAGQPSRYTGLPTVGLEQPIWPGVRGCGHR